MRQVLLPTTGRDSTSQTNKSADKIVEKSALADALFAGLLDLSTGKLSSDKSVSERLLAAYAGWVYINVSTLAEEVSKLEPILHQMKVTSEGIEFEEIDQHPILDLLDRINDKTTSSDAFYLTEAHLDLTGDSFWYLEGGAGGGQPTAIYLYNPTKIDLILGQPDRDGTLVEGYQYKDVIDGKSVEQRYEPEEMLQFKVPNPSNMYRGQSAIEALAQEVDTDNYAIDAVKNYFVNGMLTPFVLHTDQKITQDQLKGLKAELKAAFTGSKNAFKVPIFGGGLAPQTIQASLKDSDFIATQTWLRDKTMAAFKNTKASLGITDDVNRANAEASLLNWKRSVVVPKMQRIADVLNEFLVPRYGDNLILGFKDPVPEDEGAKIGRVTQLKNADLITTNEAREQLGYEPVEGGDEMGFQRSERRMDSIQQFNGERVYVPSTLKYLNLRPSLRRMKAATKASVYKELHGQFKKEAKKLLTKPKAQKQEYASLSDTQVWDYYDKQIEIVEHTEAIFQHQLEQFIGRVVDQGIGNVDNETARRDGKLIDKAEMTQEAVAKFTPILTEVAIQAGNQAMRLAGQDKPYIPKALKAFNMRDEIQKQIELFAGSMLDTDIETMTDIIAEGLNAGSSIPAIRKEIQDKFVDFTKSQAERITRTEVISTSNKAAVDAYRQSGVVEAKQWLTAMDDRVDGECEELNGKIVGLEGDFYKADFGSGEEPPLHPNCRCTVLPVLVNAKALSKEDANRISQDMLIHKLELQIDKRTKDYRDLQTQTLAKDDYIKELEKLAGVGDDS